MSYLNPKHAGLCLALCLSQSPASAEDLRGAHVSIELNAVEAVEDPVGSVFSFRMGTHSTSAKPSTKRSSLIERDGSTG